MITGTGASLISSEGCTPIGTPWPSHNLHFYAPIKRALHQSQAPHKILQCLKDTEHGCPAKELEIGFSYMRVADLNMKESSVSRIDITPYHPTTSFEA